LIATKQPVEPMPSQSREKQLGRAAKRNTACNVQAVITSRGRFHRSSPNTSQMSGSIQIKPTYGVVLGAVDGSGVIAGGVTASGSVVAGGGVVCVIVGVTTGVALEFM
jgi:hypothetical protein